MIYQVTKIAENNVEVRKSKQAMTQSKTMVDVFIDPPESYGATRLAEEFAAIQAEKDKINNFDKVKELTKLKEREDMLKEVESAMNADISKEK